MDISIDKKRELLKAQQGELNGVKIYLQLAKTVHNESDAKAFRELVADEGWHASIFRQYTEEVLTPQKGQAFVVTMLYHLLGKRVLYPIIAKSEYTVVPGYEQMMKEFPEVEGVKNDEKHHGDTHAGFGHIGCYRRLRKRRSKANRRADWWQGCYTVGDLYRSLAAYNG